MSSAVELLRSMYALDSVVVCKPVNNAKLDLKQRDELKNKALSVLENIRYKQVIRDAILSDANNGMYAAYFNNRKKTKTTSKTLRDVDVAGITEILEDDVYASIFPLPLDYIRIISRRNNSYVVAFNLDYFTLLRDTDELDRVLYSFPKEIRDGWISYESGKTTGNWLVLDNNNTIVTKIKSETSDPYGIPFAAAAFNDVEYAQYFINTKRRILDSVNNKVIYEVFPEGQNKGTSSLTQKQQQDQHNTIKQALNNRVNDSGISFFSLAAGTKMDSLTVDLSILDEKNENPIINAVNKGVGVSATALDGSSNGNFAAASINLEVIAASAYTWISDIAAELNKCINANIIKNPDCLAEFYILPATFVNRQKQVGYMKDLYLAGSGSLTAWIAATGFDPGVYLSLMDYELEQDFENKYPAHGTSFNGAAAPRGRPVKDDGDAAESTETTRNNDANNSPKPSVS